MKLNTKIAAFFSVLAIGMISVLVVISLYSFRVFSIASAEEHVRTAAEIVRVHLTESMINGTIQKRESFLRRLTEVQGLETARVLRGPMVVQQFGKGLTREEPADALEREVLAKGDAKFEVIEHGMDVTFRGTIPFTATAHGTPNCLTCHQVAEGAVLGAVTLTLSISPLKQKALVTILYIVGTIALASLLAFLFLRRLVRPLVATATDIDRAVQRAVEGDFTSRIERRTNDEIGRIAEDMNRLFSFLQGGLTSIGSNVARLIEHVPSGDRNLLTTTGERVEALIRAAKFKQSIEEDETTHEIYRRLAALLEGQFAIRHFSIYESRADRNQLVPVVVDGEANAPSRWCDPALAVRTEACRARRTGHVIDGLATPGICYCFKPPAEYADARHVCLPVMQSGGVGSVVQLVVTEGDGERVREQLPYVHVFLRETAPVLEAKRLTETLRDSSVRDGMTGLHNRRFLEEYVETLVASSDRRKTRLSVLMLDLDYFKMVNDTHGHDAGDAVLKALAKVLVQAVRASDTVIRYGGEEFLAILQDTPAEAAERVAEKIRVSVEQLKIPISGTVLQKTISIGIAEYPGESETLWQAIKYADVALYKAKEGGRNRVVRFKPEMWQDKGEY